MLTKSLHTITAALNVARYLRTISVVNQRMDAHDLACAALKVLGYEADNFATDPTQVKILRGCAAIVSGVQS